MSSLKDFINKYNVEQEDKDLDNIVRECEVEIESNSKEWKVLAETVIIEMFWIFKKRNR